MLQEDSIEINIQFIYNQDIIVKYSIQVENIYNFNKTSFQIGVIRSIKVITSSKRYIQPNLIQLGNQEQVIAIISIYTTRYIILPFIIYKECVYILVQYKEVNILLNQKILVSKNSQINNKLSFKQLEYFDVYTKTH